jgi:sugar fermentation stimulation protein A
MYKFNNLQQGKFIKRYKRFFVDIEYKDTIITAHNPNTGSMKGLLKEGNPVVFSESNNPKRKLKYTLEGIYSNNHWTYTNTVNVNKIVEKAILDKDIQEFNDFSILKREYKYKDSRIDFYLEKNKRKVLIEVKNVTLFEEEYALFPDAITTRGKKHLLTLTKSLDEGFTPYMLYVIAVNKEKFRTAKEIDEEYAKTYEKSISLGLKTLLYKNIFDTKKQYCKLVKMPN